MQKNLLIAGLVVTLSVGLAACTPKPETQKTANQDQESMVATSDNYRVDSNVELPTAEETVAEGRGQYLEYSPELVAEAAEEGKVVLFFHAPWCPTCRAADKDITNGRDQIPADLTILKTDYDTQKELKEKYGVTYQHTFVQVDAAGEMITKWNGGELDEIVQRVQ